MRPPPPCSLLGVARAGITPEEVPLTGSRADWRTAESATGEEITGNRAIKGVCGAGVAAAKAAFQFSPFQLFFSTKAGAGGPTVPG